MILKHPEEEKSQKGVLSKRSRFASLLGYSIWYSIDLIVGDHFTLLEQIMQVLSVRYTLALDFYDIVAQD